MVINALIANKDKYHPLLMQEPGGPIILAHHTKNKHKPHPRNPSKKETWQTQKPKTAFFPASARPPLNDYPEPGVSAESFTRDYLVLRKMRDFVIPLGREGWHSRQVSATLKPVRYVCTPVLT